MSCGCGNVWNNGYGGVNCGCNGFNQSPIYNCGPTCPTQYTPIPPYFVQQPVGILVQNSWVVPADDGTLASLVVPNLSNILAGSFLESPTWGKFLINSYNPTTQTVVITNPGYEFNAAPGTAVPANLLFLNTQLLIHSGTWSPVASGNGSLTVAATFTMNDYKVIEDSAQITAQFSAVLTGTSSDEIIITLPFAINTGKNAIFNARITESSVSIQGYGEIISGSLVIRKYNGANYSSGDTVNILVGGSYPVLKA